MKLLASTSAALLFALLCGCGDNSSAPKAPAAAAPPPETPSVGSNGGQTQIALIPPSQVTDTWRLIHAGSAKAISKVKKGADGKPIMDILWKPSDKPGDPQAQVQSAQKLIDDGIAAIVIAPDSAQNLKDITAAAAAHHVPVIALDSSFGSEGCKSAIASDDAKAGELAAEYLGKAHHILIIQDAANPAAASREKSFRAAIAALNTAVPITESSPENAATALAAAEPAFDALFATDEPAADSALAAVAKIHPATKPTFLAAGNSPKLAAALKSGELSAILLTDPLALGYTAVKTAGDCIREKKVEKTILVPLHLATPENLDSPEISALLNNP